MRLTARIVEPFGDCAITSMLRTIDMTYLLSLLGGFLTPRISIIP
jgi:hypothetical protein